MASIVYRQRHSNRRIYGVELNGTIITVTVTSTASVVKRWISATLFLRREFLYGNRLVVGLGVQWTSTTADADRPADTLQLCVGLRCLIFQLAHAAAAPNILRNFFMNPRLNFVGFWNYSDRRKLQVSGHRLEMFKDPLDLRLRAVTADGSRLVRASVNEIVAACLGFDVDQRRIISASNWHEEVLSEEQVLYACVDAHCAFLIGKNHRAWNFNRLREEYSEFRRLNLVNSEGRAHVWFSGGRSEAVPFCFVLIHFFPVFTLFSPFLPTMVIGL